MMPNLIFEGCYYNDGRNETINNVIEYLYNLRLTFKTGKNPAQMVIQSLMNSMYGKTIIKLVEAYTIVKGSKDDFEQHIPYTYKYIDSVLEVKGVYYIKTVHQFYHIIISSIVVSRFYP